MDFVIPDKNWRDVDQLGGVDLEEGERIRVLWPDLSKTEETVLIDNRDYDEQDMWTSFRFKKRMAYVAKRVNMAECRVYLGVSGCRCERVK